MKKALSMILVLTMVLALALPAMAVDDITTTGDTSKNVTAIYKGPENKISGKIYTVEIKWESQNTEKALSYTGATTAYVWTPEKMQYVASDKTSDGSVAAAWDGSAKVKVTVTNKSNDAIGYKVTATNTYDLTLTGSDTDNTQFTTIDNPVSGITDANVAGSEKGAAGGQPADVTTGTKIVTYAANESARTNVSLTNQELVVGTITVKIQTTTTGNS